MPEKKPMHWLKKAFFGVAFCVFLFIVMGILAGAGIEVFGSDFLSTSMFLLLIVMGVFEINLATYG